MISAISRIAFVAALAAVGGLRNADHAPPTYEVYAVRYATLPGFRVSGLLAGADTSRRMDLAMMVWVIRGGGRTILVDAGFHRDDFVNRWHPTGFVPPSDAIGRLGIKPEDVTDVIISHVHWDHLDGIDLFPRARVWMQREEFDHHLDSTGARARSRHRRRRRETAGRHRARGARDARRRRREGNHSRHHRVHGRQTHVRLGVRDRARPPPEPSSSRRTTRTSTRISRSTSRSPRRSTRPPTYARKRAC